MNEEERFIQAFELCVEKGIYPGPTVLNLMMRNSKRNKLNGRLSRLRLELMRKHNIPYQRNGAYGDKGEVPRDEPLTAQELYARQTIRL